MGNTLCIDVSVEPAQAVVTSYASGAIEIKENHSFDASGLFSRDSLSTSDDPEENLDEQVESEIIDTDNSRVQDFENVLSRISSPWENSLLILPTFDYVSLNLELPFGDQKNINKILPFEVQDIVPFEIDDFYLDPKVTDAIGQNLFKVHVGVIPRLYIQNSIQICHQAGFEPEKISSPASVLAGIKTLAPNYFADNALLFYSSDKLHYFSVLIDGEPTNDRVVEIPVYDRVDGINQGAKELLLTQLKLTLASSERRNQCKIDNVYVFSDLFAPSELQQGIGRNSEILKISEFVRSDTERSGLASLAGVFDRSEEIDSLLTNFRANEFAYNPFVKEIVKASKKLLPSVILACIVCIISAVVIYSVRALEIASLGTAIADQVRTSVPNLSIDDDRALLDLNAAISKINGELSSLGSPSNLSPLDGLLAVHSTLPPADGFSINEVQVTDNKIIVKGKAGRYQEIDKIEQAFKKKRTVFCRIERPDTSSRGGKEINFALTLRMCKS